LKVLNQYDIKIKACQVVIIGSGRLTGKPLLLSLLNQQATVSVLNEFTASLDDYTRKADILISGAGQANIINYNVIKKGAVVIDAGISVETIHGGKSMLKGDIDSTGIEKKAKIFVPSSGGLGPITVAMVMRNLIELNNES
jgi:methylenetetrahydrofolate dehydrogenase (NADP+)/methenyltetrahydrofolate cyclohydrolase